MSAMLAKIFNLAQTNRVLLSRILLSSVFPAVLLTHLSWPERALLGFAVEDAAFLLIIVGAFGRIWATLYVAGRKGKELVTSGPYSVCRNPLYFFSLLMGLGIVAAFQNLLLYVPLALFHLGSYFFTILAEERALAERFGTEYENYRARVPRFLPAFWRYRGGNAREWMSISERRVLRCLFESALFVMIIPLAELIEELHVRGILPVIWKH
ncbi:isoprenylcysteine carboxylmethyltransferase family protein [bacterium]|nr:isoprenylcysteine carboxylmethyltransferase family protein [bacterium]